MSSRLIVVDSSSMSKAEAEAKGYGFLPLGVRIGQISHDDEGTYSLRKEFIN